MFALVIIINGIEVARQYHETWDKAHVASMDLIPSVALELKIIEVEKQRG